MEQTDLKDVFQNVRELFKQYEKRLQIVADKPTRYELEFDKEYTVTSQKTGEKKSKRGLFFAGIRLEQEYVALDFLPIYSHYEMFELPHSLEALLKGKSCFHIQSLNGELKTEIKEMLERGYVLYKHYSELSK